MISRAWSWLKERLTGLWAQVRSVGVKALTGTTILLAAGALYLGPYFTGMASCLDEITRALSSAATTDWQCFGNVVDDLRRDGTAATVILAIAAAMLASAWSSGRAEE